MAKTCEVEIWIAVNEEGEYDCGTDADDLVESFEADIGGKCRRLVKVTLTVPMPEVIEIEATVEEEEAEPVVTVK